ncbi:hypothetical protein ACIGCP_13055 [Cellulophaga baltica]|uniref:hypothetical protein n=1 Tax=Cellulophaga baltica TaxID=76594 RepID=UPI0037CB71F6
MLKIFKINSSLMILLILFSCCKSFSQKDTEEQVIGNFLLDLYDKNISAEKVVDKYLIFSVQKNPGGVIGRDVAIQHILNIRLNKKITQNWLMPTNNISNLKIENIVDYKSHEILDKQLFFTYSNDSLKKDIYILLNEEKNEILQYFLIKDNKIRAFSLFVKTNDASFFTYD